MSDDVDDILQTYLRKWAHHQKELAKTRDPGIRFSLQEELEEIEKSIVRFGGEVPAPKKSEAGPTNAGPAPANETVATPPTSGKYVFLSYLQEDQTRVEKLRAALVQQGHSVWWDQDIDAGQNWRIEIRKALKTADAFILCLSTELEKRVKSGVYPEIRDAIAAYRELPPGGIFIIPVRLDACEIPFIEIDATTMLDDLQYVDLFPESAWQSGVGRILRSLG